MKSFREVALVTTLVAAEVALRAVRRTLGLAPLEPSWPPDPHCPPHWAQEAATEQLARLGLKPEPTFAAAHAGVLEQHADTFRKFGPLKAALSGGTLNSVGAVVSFGS